MSEPESFESRTRETFRASVESLPARTRSRLTQARHAALEAAAHPNARSARLRIWAPAFAAACALVLAVALWTGMPQRALMPAAVEHHSALEDLDIVASREDFELLDDDVDFYQWVAETPDAHEATVG
jgi:hypothetical protein